MKIALAQINPTVGDIKYNFDLIVTAVKKAREAKAELLLLPELSLLGYPPKDLLLKPSFITAQNHYLNELALYTDENIGILVGAATDNPGFGRKLHNSLVLLHKGTKAAVGNKTLLPNYDVFDEFRYFEAAPSVTVIDFKGIKFGLSICEDIWIEAYPSLYSRDPIAELVSEGAQIIINAAASPYVYDKHGQRKKLLANAARRYQKPIIYVNQVGANDQLIFDGNSLLLNNNGEIIKNLLAFKEDFYAFDIEDLTAETMSQTGFHPSKHLDAEDKKLDLASIYQALVLGLKDYVRKCGFKKAILGVSGGIDSALVAAIAVEALGKENVYLLAMPSKFTSKQSIDDAVILAKNLGVLDRKADPTKCKISQGANFEIIPIETLHNEMHDLMPQLKDHQADENLQARLRAVILMAFSNTLHAMLLNTGNKSEAAVGYCTIYGDMCGGLAVISDLLKTSVYRIADYINEEAKKSKRGEIIPESTIKRAPTAELRHGQYDQEKLPPYEILDQIILFYVQGMKSAQQIIDEGFDPELVRNVINMIDKAEYKRYQAPPGLKIAGKAFGLGRRMPIAQGFEHNGYKNKK